VTSRKAISGRISRPAAPGGTAPRTDPARDPDHDEGIVSPGDRCATKDFKTGAVRDHGTDANRFNGLDQAGGSHV
jgi:hypothetical protein